MAIKRARQLALIPYVRTRDDIMEVILREHVDTLGRRGDIVKVAEGYARNYLLPRKLALAVNRGNKRQIERERKNAEAREPRRSRRPKRSPRGSTQLEIAIARRVGENDTLYGSVTTADIAAGAGGEGLRGRSPQDQLAEPLKALGE